MEYHRAPPGFAPLPRLAAEHYTQILTRRLRPPAHAEAVLREQLSWPARDLAIAGAARQPE
jgi:hypothetical protein